MQKIGGVLDKDRCSCLFDWPVLIVEEKYARLKGGGFLVLDHGIGDDDDAIADGGESGCRSVEFNDAAVAFSGNGVTLKPFAVVEVDDLYLFAGEDVGLIQEFLVDGDTAFIIEL